MGFRLLRAQEPLFRVYEEVPEGASSEQATCPD